MSYIDEVFGPGGFFAQAFPGYEARAGQIALARVVDEAMQTGQAALGEGPCGTGKGMAYGVPAVWHAINRRKRVVIVTANIALQEQLVTKDLPMLQALLPWRKPLGEPFTFALLKGRSNYLCGNTLSSADDPGDEFAYARRRSPEDDAMADAIRAWAGRTSTGDISELPFIPPKPVWSRFSVGADDCKGRACKYVKAGGVCFPAEAMARASEADIVVTNYHLFFAHLNVRSVTDMDIVMPGAEIVVMDEAHEAADIARDFFGFMITEGSIRKLARWCKRAGDEELADELRADAQHFFSRVRVFAKSKDYHRRLKRPDYVDPRSLLLLLKRAQDMARKIIADGADKEDDDDAVLRLLPLCYQDPGAGDGKKDSKESESDAKNSARRAAEIASNIREAVALDDPNKVYWVEVDDDNRDVKIKAKVIDVSGVLSSELYGEHNEKTQDSKKIESVVMVSATMTTSGNFDFVRNEMGVPPFAIEVVAESPFDFMRQSLMVVPRDIAEPAEDAFPADVARVFERVINDVGGRTLGLFTSYRVLNIVHQHIAGGAHRVLRQGDAPRTELAIAFKSDPGSVLLGTESFWTGIDVPGESLTCVVIDKLPFPHMDDPFIDFVCGRDRDSFKTVMIPRAAMLLRQGVGRLIRAQTDVGVVVICDRRFAEKPYSSSFVSSLPRMHRTRSLDDVQRFLRARAPGLALPEPTNGSAP